MADNYIKFIYHLIESKFGVSQDEIETIDLTDGKKDASYHGTSLFTYFNNNTTTGKSKLGSLSCLFMSVNAQTEPVVCTTNDNNPNQYDNLVDRLKNEDSFFSAIYELNEKNVVEVLERYKTKDRMIFLSKSLIKSILNKNIGIEEKKIYINRIKDALLKRIKKLNGDTKYTLLGYSFVLNMATSMLLTNKLDTVFDELIKIIKQLEALKESGESITPEAAKKINKNFLKNIENKGISVRDILGNGIFDHDSVQETGNCWIHAGINAMRQNYKSEQHLNNLIHKSSNGNISVYLPGAKDVGLPKPKGDGIYVYTEKQIAEALKEESAGDGDYTAVCLAMRDFKRAQAGNANATTVGGSFFEFCQLIYGQKANLICFGDRLTDDSRDRAKAAKELINKYKDSLSENDIEELSIISNLDSCDAIYKNLKKAFESHQYIFKVSISAANYYRILDNKPVIPDNNAGHAMSIISISDSEIVLKDSNNPNIPIIISATDFCKICSIDGYKI